MTKRSVRNRGARREKTTGWAICPAMLAPVLVLAQIASAATITVDSNNLTITGD